MKVFSNYAQYYDLLNQGKDYKQEVQYIVSLLKQYLPKAKNILDLGCGTGLHAIQLGEIGFEVHGVDQSQEMISIATERLANYANSSKSIDFSVGDVRSVKLNKKFDAVLALFHVMSYQTTNDDIDNTLESASKHLSKNGVLIFDCWYGPAVISDKPYVRTKSFENDELRVDRTAIPTLYPSKNLVDVNFDISILDKESGVESKFTELHKMRYLFEPEMELMLNNNGFELLRTEEWLTGKTPDYDTWYITFICRKK